MGPDVGKGARFAAHRRIGPPRSLFAALGVRFSRQPILKVDHDDPPDVTEFTRFHPCARLDDERIAGIGVRNAEKQAGFLDSRRYALRILKIVS